MTLLTYVVCNADIFDTPTLKIYCKYMDDEWHRMINIRCLLHKFDADYNMTVYAGIGEDDTGDIIKSFTQRTK